MTVIIYSILRLASGAAAVAAGLLRTLGLNVPALIKSTQHPTYYDSRQERALVAHEL